MTSDGQVVLKTSTMKQSKRCKNIPQNSVKYSKCDSVFHPECVKYVKDFAVLKDGSIICCENANTCPELHTQHELLGDKEIIYSGNSFDSATENIETSENILKIENKFLKKLLKEKDIMINSLCENTTLLKQNINLLNKSIQSSPSIETDKWFCFEQKQESKEENQIIVPPMSSIKPIMLCRYVNADQVQSHVQNVNNNIANVNTISRLSNNKYSDENQRNKDVYQSKNENQSRISIKKLPV